MSGGCKGALSRELPSPATRLRDTLGAREPTNGADHRTSASIELVPYDEVSGQGIEDMLHRIPLTERVAEAVGWRPTRDLEQIFADVIAGIRDAPSQLAESA